MVDGILLQLARSRPAQLEQDIDVRYTADDLNPPLPIIRKIPQLPWFRVLKVNAGFLSSTVVRSFSVPPASPIHY